MPRGVYKRKPRSSKAYEYKPCLGCGATKEAPHHRGQRYCKPCIEAGRIWRRQRNAVNCWERMIYQRYKLRPEDYKRMLTKQKGRCAICRGKQKIRLSVDHNHNTKKLRGLLCVKCNTSLGYIEGRKQWMKKAYAYLRRYK